MSTPAGQPSPTSATRIPTCCAPRSFTGARRRRCARSAAKSRSRWCRGCSATGSARCRGPRVPQKRSPHSTRLPKNSPCTSSRSAVHVAGTISSSRTLRVCRHDRHDVVVGWPNNCCSTFVDERLGARRRSDVCGVCRRFLPRDRRIRHSGVGSMRWRSTVRNGKPTTVAVLTSNNTAQARVSGTWIAVRKGDR